MRRLIHLQEIMVAAESLGERIAAIPSEVARLEKDLLAAQQDLEKSRGTLQEMQKDRRRLESELQSIEARITKYQTQLLEVKTNKEYQAMQHEIETCRAERSTHDEKILLEMEETEKRNAALRALEEGMKEKRRATDEGKKRLDEQAAALGREKEALEAERKTLAAAIPPLYLDPFMKVARQRKGLALVAVRGELCGGCHVRVMPKLVQEVRRFRGPGIAQGFNVLDELPDPGELLAGQSGQPADVHDDRTRAGGAREISRCRTATGRVMIRRLIPWCVTPNRSAICRLVQPACRAGHNRTCKS